MDDEEGRRSAHEDEDDYGIEGYSEVSQPPTKAISPFALKTSPPLPSAGRLPAPSSEPESPMQAVVAKPAETSAEPPSIRLNSYLGVV